MPMFVPRPRAAILLSCALLSFATAQAQEYPVRPVRLVVSFGPGGSADIAARVVAARLSDALGQQVIIDNKPGGNTIVGTEFVARAAPDGYTLLLATSSFSSNPSMYKKLPFDAQRDFTSVVMIGDTPNMFAVNPALPVRTVKQLVDLAKARPGELNYATASYGAIHHFTGELLNQRAGIKTMHVPYKGGAQAVIDVVSGQVPVIVCGIPTASPYLASRRLYPLAVTVPKRSPALPMVPTMAESGYPGFESSLWFAILAPAGTPRPVVDKLNQATNAVVRTAAVKEQLAVQGIEPAGGTSAAVDRFIREDTARWAKVIKTSNLHAIE